MKKLKAEIKRLRQDLIMKPSTKDNMEDFDQEFTDQQKQALRMLPSEQQRALQELRDSGANREYIKQRFLASIGNNEGTYMFMMEENRIFR